MAATFLSKRIYLTIAFHIYIYIHTHALFEYRFVSIRPLASPGSKYFSGNDSFENWQDNAFGSFRVLQKPHHHPHHR